MPVLYNIGQLARCCMEGGQDQLHLLRNAAVAWEDGKFIWIGPQAQLPSHLKNLESIDAHGRLVIPGLIDCHTHLAFGGWREKEFEARIQGKKSQEGCEAGIVSTVCSTRNCSEEQLMEKSLHFLKEMASLGITTIEAKSGYGLDLDNELKLLHVYRKLRLEQPIKIVSTFLGAHVVPPEKISDRRAYLKIILEEMLPKIGAEHLAEFCDVFVEKGAFSVEEAREIFKVATQYGLHLKLHADQLSCGKGAELACEAACVSADHLECVSDEGIAKLSRSKTVAVTLPLACLYLGKKPLDARRLIEANIPVAVATDFNPGSAPSYHLPLAMMLACTMQKMTPAQALKGATIYAAQALNRHHQIGSIELGKHADLAVIDACDVTHWLYHFRANACTMTVMEGVPFYVPTRESFFV